MFRCFLLKHFIFIKQTKPVDSEDSVQYQYIVCLFLNLSLFFTLFFIPQVVPYDYETITGIVHFQSETPEMLTIQLIVHLIVKDLCYAKVLVTREWVHFQLHFTREMVLYHTFIVHLSTLMKLKQYQKTQSSSSSSFHKVFLFQTIS